MKKRVLLLLTAVFFLLLFSGVAVYAEEETSWDETTACDSYIEEILEALPSEVKDHLPEAEDGSYTQKADLSYVLSLSASFFQKAFLHMLQYTLFFLSILLLSALSERVEEALGGIGRSAASLVGLLLISLEAFSMLFSLFEEVRLYSERMGSFLLTLNGVMASVALLGGGVNEASVMTATLSTLVTLLGNLFSTLFLPVMRLSFASTLSSAVSPKIHLGGMAAFVRKAFLSLMGFLSTLTVVILTFQTSVAQAQDTVASRGLKFAASSSIPLVGGAVSDSIRTLSAGVSLIKRSVGALGVLSLLILALYPLASLFAARVALTLAEYAATLLGVEKGRSLLEEIGKLVGMLIATVAMIAVLYLFAVSLYATSAAAVA